MPYNSIGLLSTCTIVTNFVYLFNCSLYFVTAYPPHKETMKAISDTKIQISILFLIKYPFCAETPIVFITGSVCPSTQGPRRGRG